MIDDYEEINELKKRVVQLEKELAMAKISHESSGLIKPDVMGSGFVSKYCKGEKCFCGKVATHKIEETVFDDDPLPNRHELTSYVCDGHFNLVMYGK
jgi:hypothetical protein